MTITPYQKRELQRAVNAWDNNHVKDLLGPVRVDSTVDQKTKDVFLRAAYYFGIGQPTIRHWDKYGFNDKDVANLTDWFVHPSHFYKTHRFAQGVSKTRIAAERAKRAVTKVFRTRTWVNADGSRVEVAGWIYNILQAAWGDGIRFHVTDGVRSLAEAWYLWDHRAENPNPVSYPGSSHHTGVIWPDAAVDIAPRPGAQSFSNWLRNNPRKARGLKWADPDDTVHFSVPGSHHAGEASY